MPASLLPSPGPEQEALRRDLDGALDAIGQILRARARHAFPLGDGDTRALAAAYETWAAHLLVRSPPPGAADSPETGGGGARDFRGFVDFIATRARVEQDWVFSSTRDMREAIFALVESFRVASVTHGRHDGLLHQRLASLNDALENGAFETLKREARQVAATMTQVLEDQRSLAELQANQLRERLTHLGEQLEQTRREGETDPLTQIANRRLFDVTLPRMLSVAAVMRRPVTVMMVDVDHFKSFNDAFGHQVGDEVLRAVADAMTRAFPRRSDLVARYGGEEFAIVLSDTGRAEAPMLEHRLLSAIRASRIPVGEKLLSVTVSVGVAFAEPEETASELVARADAALYAAKRAGRDRAVTAEARAT